MRCAELRDRLLTMPTAELTRLVDPPSDRAAVAPGPAAHLADCADCAAFARRAAALRGGLPAHRSEAVPGPEFAARVVARLPGGAAEMLGWASLRLLPAALALAVAFSWYGLSRGPGLTSVLLHADDPLVLSYVAFGPETAE